MLGLFLSIASNLKLELYKKLKWNKKKIKERNNRKGDSYLRWVEYLPARPTPFLRNWPIKPQVPAHICGHALIGGPPIAHAWAPEDADSRDPLANTVILLETSSMAPAGINSIADYAQRNPQQTTAVNVYPGLPLLRSINPRHPTPLTPTESRRSEQGACCSQESAMRRASAPPNRLCSGSRDGKEASQDRKEHSHGLFGQNHGWERQRLLTKLSSPPR